MAAKFALIIGNSRYDDLNLGRLQAPDLDVKGLEEVLKAPNIGQFDEVITLVNEGCASVRKAIARFYDRRQRDDLLLLYFSGHGVKDDQGHLYLALRDTESALLSGSAIETAFITDRMDRSFSKRQVLVLDCCHSGAFANGAKAAQGVSVGTAEAFEGTGLGRVILSATDSTQYAWEGDRVIGDAQTSLFTHFLIDGLRTGAADRDDDGLVTVDELYDYVRDQVVDATPRQTPRKWSYREQSDIVLAQNPTTKRWVLPPDIGEAKNSRLSSLRLVAVRDLEQLLRGQDSERSRAALTALKELSLDDSRKVANAAIQVLKAYEEERAVPPKDPDRSHAPQTDTRHGTRGRGVRGPGESPSTLETRIEVLPSDIFISYEHHDRDKARALANALGAQGWTVWWDRRIAPGEAFDMIIERELASCKCVIVLWSARSVGATWVRNEARRAARRKVLVPVLIEPVEPPLEFENLQAADLATWDANAEHPEFEAVLDRIQAFAPSRHHPARVAVDNARREFAAGRTREALNSLEQFRPMNILVSHALKELRADAERIESGRAEAVRRDAQGVQRQRFAVATARIEERLGRVELDAAEQELSAAEKEFGALPECRLLRERLTALRDHAQRDQLARAVVDSAPRESANGRTQTALARLEGPADRAVEKPGSAEPPGWDQLVPAQPSSESTLKLFKEPGSLRHSREGIPQRSSLTANVAIERQHRASSLLRSRSVQIAIAGLLALIVGAWIVSHRPRLAAGSPGDPSQQARRGATTTGEPASPPETGRASPAATGSASPPSTTTPAATPVLPSSRIDAVPPTRPAARESRPAANEPAANEPGEVPRAKPASASNVEELRTRARLQRQSGEHVEALNTVVEGLRRFSKDPVLTSMLNSLLVDAQSAAARAKQEAIRLDAKAKAVEPFSQGLQREGEAARLRRTGRIDASTRAWWAAADQFAAAAAESRQVAEEEEAEQARINSNKATAGAGAQTRLHENVERPADPKLPDSAVEKSLVDRTLRAYEAAYVGLSAEAVRSVFPAGPIEQLGRDFAGYQSYVLRIRVEAYDFLFNESLWIATVPAVVLHEIRPKSGQAARFEQSQTFQLVKQGNTWIIRTIR
jgi:TIR domain/Caspase domain